MDINTLIKDLIEIAIDRNSDKNDWVYFNLRYPESEATMTYDSVEIKDNTIVININ